MSGNRDKYPELLSQLAEEAAEVLIDEHVLDDRERAAEIGFRVAERIRKSWSGLSLYMPEGIYWELSLRDIEIFNRFDGRNIQFLAREFGLSEVRIYQVIKRVRAEEVKRRQGDLFGEPASSES